MSYKSRQRKRKKRIAIARNQRAARTLGSSASRWWLTIVGNDTCCARCGRILRSGDEFIYRHCPQEGRCIRCGEQLADSRRFGVSQRWERSRRTKARRLPPVAAFDDDRTPGPADPRDRSEA